MLTTLLLAATLATQPVVTRVVFAGGATMDVESFRTDGGRAVFVRQGRTYSLPLSELDMKATLSPAPEAPVPQQVKAEPSLGMRVSREERDRILRELEAKKPEKKPVAQTPTVTVSAPRVVEPPPKSAAERADEQRARKEEERYWREQSRSYEEELRRRQEDLALLRSRVQQLEDQVLSLLSLGYKPQEFSLQVMQLQRSRDAIPQAELEVQRAERAQRQFLEDARREGILPGWLR